MTFRKAADLKWSETPWDFLTREELLLMVCRYHSALISLASCVRMSRVGNKDHPYYGVDGSAGRAITKADFLAHLCGDDTDDGADKIYRSFFRPVGNLLFPGVALGRFGNWYICESCGAMVSSPSTDTPSKLCKCDGTWRPARMSDIRPDLEIKP